MNKIFYSIPNIITIFRILVVPFIIESFFSDSIISKEIGSLLFLLCCISDYLDGFIARKYNIVSKFGKIFDPIADKILISSCICALLYFNKINIIPAIVIISREILISGIREVLGQNNKFITVSKLGKLKTSIQMISIFLLISGSEKSNIYAIGEYFFWISAFLSVISLCYYINQIKSHLSE